MLTRTVAVLDFDFVDLVRCLVGFVATIYSTSSTAGTLHRLARIFGAFRAEAARHLLGEGSGELKLA